MSAVIIDDDPEFVKALGGVLLELGYAVSDASNVGEAEALLAKEQIDLAVVDLNLASENGIELIRQMGMKKPHTHVIATTGVESDLYLQIAGYVGAHVCVRKFPSSPDGRFPGEDWKRVIAKVRGSEEKASSQKADASVQNPARVGRVSLNRRPR